MRITVNLASRPFADLGPALKLLRIAMAVLALLSIGLAFGIHAFHQHAEEARAHDRAIDAQIATLNQERLGYEQRMKQPDNAQLLAHVAILNQLFDEKTFSWTLAMEDLETVLPGGVQAVTLEPLRDKKLGITSLRLRVSGPRDKAVELVRNLEHSRYFMRPAIIGESAESQGGPGQRQEPISPSNRFNFDVQAIYNIDALGEHQPKPAAEKQPQAETPPAVSAHRPAPQPLPPPGKPRAFAPPAPMAPGSQQPPPGTPARKPKNLFPGAINPMAPKGGAQ
jgi:type IV pilus assembly protein PilN